MPIWRRLLCIVIGAPMAFAGLSLLAGGGPPIPTLFIAGLGGLLALSGASPKATRDY